MAGAHAPFAELLTALLPDSQRPPPLEQPFWAAPEIIRHSTYGVKADIYSFGIVLWELVAREDPYQGIPSVQVPFMVTEEQLRPKVPSFCDSDFRKLMCECWDDDPDKRPAWDTIQKELEKIYVDTVSERYTGRARVRGGA